MIARRSSWLLITALMATTACGTTVPLSQVAQPAGGGGDGLSAGPGGSAPSSGGAALPGAASPTGVRGPVTSVPTGTTAPSTSSGGPVLAGQPTVRGPLKLGILDAKSPAAAASATGAQNAAGVDPAALTRAFVRYYNVHGGMAGRKIEPVEYTIDPTALNYETELSAACARFTQDNHLPLVISQTGNVFSGNYENCLTKAGVTNLEVANGAPDAQALRSYPRLFTTSSPSVDRRVTAQLRGSTATGLLTRTTPVGIIVENCPENARAYTSTIAPLARSLGLSLTRRDVNCVTGFADAGAFFTQVGSAVLPFNTARISRVLFVTSFEVAALQAFENQAQGQGYAPSYVLSSIASTAAQAGQYSAGAQQRMYGVGWIPVLDTTGVPQSAAAKRCLAIARSQGQIINNQSDYVFLLQVCDLFGAANAALVSARGSTDPAAFATGLASAMASFESANVLGGRLRLSQRSHDGPAVFAPFGYVSSCSCFRYTQKPSALA
jgi:hypothetical protein